MSIERMTVLLSAGDARRLLIAALLPLLLAASGCSDSDEPTDSGAAGDTGTAGDTGLAGDTGTVGDTGPSGDTGTAGDSGAGGDSGADTGVPDAGGTCTPTCGAARECCGAECTNLQNDPRNCGACGVACGDGEFCTSGSCTDVPCTTTCDGDEGCCGTMCCGAGTICCDPQGPVSGGPRCVAPDDRGTCPVGCAPLCMEG